MKFISAIISGLVSSFFDVKKDKEYIALKVQNEELIALNKEQEAVISSLTAKLRYQQSIQSETTEDILRKM